MTTYRSTIKLTLVNKDPRDFINLQTLEQNIKKNIEILIKHNWHEVEIEDIKVKTTVTSQL